MKLLVKPLRGGQFHLEGVELTNTVRELKEMINKDQGENYPADDLKLIHGGKIMKDEQTLQDCGVKEGTSFIVCMVSKKKPKPAQAPPQQQQQAQPQAQQQQTTTQATSTGGAAPQQQQQQTAAAGQVQIREEDVQTLVGMGFVDTDVRAALQAARGNVAQASELLLNPGLLQQMQQQANESPLERFRRHPQINQLRAIVQQNPAALQAIIQQIAQADPELHAAITANHAEFVGILNEPIPPGANTQGGGAGEDGQGPGSAQMQRFFAAMAQMSAEERQAFAQQIGMNPQQLEQVTQVMQQMPPEALARMAQDMGRALPGLGGGGGGAGGGGGGGGAPGGGIQLTQADNEAIGRLQELGFSRAAAIQAYFACDKDENAAANLLFTTPFDEEDGQGGGAGTGVGGGGGLGQ